MREEFFETLEETQLEPAVQKKLQALMIVLQKNETVKAYKQLASKIADHQEIQQNIEKMKKAQQDAVQFAHYGKPEAEKVAIKEADRLKEWIDTHPLVTEYRDLLRETDELLQYITRRVQQEVNDEINK